MINAGCIENASNTSSVATRLTPTLCNVQPQAVTNPSVIQAENMSGLVASLQLISSFVVTSTHAQFFK